MQPTTFELLGVLEYDASTDELDPSAAAAYAARPVCADSRAAEGGYSPRYCGCDPT